LADSFWKSSVGGVHGKRSGQNPSDQRFRGAVGDAVRDRGPQQVAPTFLDHDIGTGTVNRKIAHVGQVSDSRQRRQLRSRAEITGTKNRQPRGRQVVIVYRACLRFAAGSVALILQEQVLDLGVSGWIGSTAPTFSARHRRAAECSLDGIPPVLVRRRYRATAGTWPSRYGYRST
jgi:hypothetical protein